MTSGSAAARAVCAVVLALPVVSAASWHIAAAGSTASAVIDPAAVAEAAAHGAAPVLIFLEAPRQRAPHGGSASATYARLERAAAATQPPLVAWLAAQGAAGIARYTVDNVVRAEVGPTTLAELPAQPHVTQVLREPILHFTAGAGPWVRAASAAPARVEPGVKAIGADAVWALGFRGAGAVVLVTDTGASFKHPALKAAYRGVDSGSDYNWRDPIDDKREPLDEDGHGTHVTGIAVGQAGERQIGVAPDAQWIACRVGRTEEEGINGGAILACLDWALAPTRLDGTEPQPGLAPDVIVASWTAGFGDSCTSGWLAGAASSLEAAGILFVTSAGNTGSACNTVCVPGNYRDVVAVANYDTIVQRVHPTSSRGPVAGLDVAKPDIAAPGTQITSAEPPAGYGVRTGTSMAAPSFAGAAALLLSVRPDLRRHPAALRAALYAAAAPLPADRCGPDDDAVPNNSAGHGLVRVDHAVETALVPTATATAPATMRPTVTATASPSAAPPDWRVFLPRTFLGAH